MSKLGRRPTTDTPRAAAAPRRRRRTIGLALAVLAALMMLAAIPAVRRMAGLAPAARAVPPNILLITLDTTRADRVGAYGYRLGRTPHLDRLATEGVLFERAVAPAPMTLPSHASLFTALYPFTHGVRNNGHFYVSDKLPTLATALHDRGYRTAAFVSAFSIDRRYGLARGFDHYDDHLEPAAAHAVNVEIERRGDRTALAAGKWLEQAARGASASAAPSPFFVWLHLFDPHEPYDPPPPFRDAFADRPYDGEIAFDDAVVGSVLARLDRLGLRASTLVAIVGDHGESLGDHGEVTHAVFVYEAALRVPMILWWPGRLPAGTRVPALARVIDLAPTLLDLAGLPPLPGAHGQSLMSLVRGGALGPSSAYAETYFPLFYMNWAPLRSIQDDRWKFIDAPAPELYDLSKDPHEQTNVAEREPARTAALRRALDSLTGGGEGTMAMGRMDHEALQKLAALGYIGAPGHTAGPGASGARPDPKVMIGVFNRLREANVALREGRLAEAEAIARDVLGRDRDNAFALQVLASARMDQGRYRDAIEGYRAYLALVPTSADAHHWIAICHLRLGDRDRALTEEEAALAIDPRHADALALRAGLLAGRGRLDEAIASLRAAVETDPDKPPLRVALADFLVDAGRFDEAEAEYRRALERQPENPNAHTGYGVLLAARGQADRAIAEFKRALELRPDHDEARLGLAEAFDRLGRRQDARVEYERLASGRATRPDIRQAARDRLAKLNPR